MICFFNGICCESDPPQAKIPDLQDSLFFTIIGKIAIMKINVNNRL